MRNLIIAWTLLCTSVAYSAPRVAVLDFENIASSAENGLLAGGVSAQDLSAKGAFLLSKEMLNDSDYVLVDRRDFTSRLPKETAKDDKPASFIHAAQLLNADAVLRGSILSFSTSRESQKQGGYSAEFNKLSMTVMLQAIDAVDGAVLAMSEGSSGMSVRQTANVQLQLGENELLTMLSDSIKSAMPELKEGLQKRLTSQATRERSTLTITATEDPALVEIDGVLVGSTPIETLEVYQGDHIIKISRPGYVSFTKRLAISKDLTIKVPMLRLDMTADERMKILSSAEMKVYMQNQKPDLLIQEIK
jgi:hypothetical protein